MSAVFDMEALRESLRASLPPNAFLKRARGDALFVANAPTALLRTAQENGLYHLYLTPEMLLEFERAQLPHWQNIARTPETHFCASLLRTALREPTEDALALFAEGLKQLEAPTDPADYNRRAHALAAAALRTGTGGAFACAVLAHALFSNEQEAEK